MELTVRFMELTVRFELMTCRLGGDRSIQLSYVSIKFDFNYMKSNKDN